MNVGFAAAFGAGVISFLSPCVLPLVPVYLAYLTGTSYTEAGKNPKWRTISHALAFIAGFSLVFIAFGASATAAGRLLFDYRDVIEKIGGAFLLVLGLWMTGLLKIGFLYKDLRVHLQEKPTGYAGSVLVGAAFAAGWTPCVGPVLGAVLLMASRGESVGYGVALLAAYSLGLAIPLLLCSLALDKSMALIRRMGPTLPIIERATGVLLLLMGGLLLSGRFSRIISWLLGTFTGWTRWMQAIGL